MDTVRETIQILLELNALKIPDTKLFSELEQRIKESENEAEHAKTMLERNLAIDIADMYESRRQGFMEEYYFEKVVEAIKAERELEKMEE